MVFAFPAGGCTYRMYHYAGEWERNPPLSPSQNRARCAFDSDDRARARATLSRRYRDVIAPERQKGGEEGNARERREKTESRVPLAQACRSRLDGSIGLNSRVSLPRSLRNENDNARVEDSAMKSADLTI